MSQLWKWIHTGSRLDIKHVFQWRSFGELCRRKPHVFASRCSSNSAPRSRGRRLQDPGAFCVVHVRFRPEVKEAVFHDNGQRNGVNMWEFSVHTSKEQQFFNDARLFLSNSSGCSIYGHSNVEHERHFTMGLSGTPFSKPSPPDKDVPARTWVSWYLWDSW